MKRIGVSLLGAGTVGGALAGWLRHNRDWIARRSGVEMQVRHVLVRDAHRGRRDIDRELLTTSVEQAIDDPAVGVVIELMGGTGTAAECVERSLARGCAVVTANKLLLAQRGPELVHLARQQGGTLLFEAAIGGAVPVVAMLRSALRGDRIIAITGVLNGTTNFILDRLGEGAVYATALAEAQAQGYAEADPSADLDGVDAAAKLTLLAWLAFGIRPDPAGVDRTGIGDVSAEHVADAARAGCALRLVASARRTVGGDSASLEVAPSWVDLSSELATVRGADNAVVIDAELAGSVVVRGRGAGGAATASAVAGDLVEALRVHAQLAPAWYPEAPDGRGVIDPEFAEATWVLRITPTGAGASAQAIQLLLDRGVEVRATTDLVGEVLLFTALTPRAVLERALETLGSLPWPGRVLAHHPYLAGPE